MLFALHTSALHLGLAAGALVGGLVIDAGGLAWVLAIGCCAAVLLLTTLLARKDTS